MKECPILFSAPMVIALRCGIKTQTRRTRGLDKINESPERWTLVNDCGPGADSGFRFSDRKCFYPDMSIRCPYGLAGDRLWTREALQIFDHDPEFMGACVGYVADGQVRGWTHDEEPPVDLSWPGESKGAKLRKSRDAKVVIPSIHMPRWASRDDLEIISTRPERVQSITEEDAIAEGIQAFDFPVPPNPPGQTQRMYGTREYFPQTSPTPVKAYRSLWEEINGPDSWAKDPWVWRIEFRRLVGGKVEAQ